MKLWVKVLVCVLLVNLIGGAGAIFTSSSIPTWYADLEKPPGVPPNWVFGPVWTTLYAMIGISVALFWHRVPPGPAKTRGWIIFSVQMILNFIWSPVFFGLHQIGWGLVIIVALLVTLVVTIIAFRCQNKIAGRLLIPYGIWVGYATYLNAGYWALNG